MIEKAIFLDRDGVLIDNSEHYYIWKPDQLRFVENVFENLQLLAQIGFQFFIVTNQGGISKGLYSKTDILNLHKELIRIFRLNQIEIKDIACCPHHPEIENCLCRKPESLMIDRLIAKYRIGKENSWFIGDSETDMQAARNAEIRGIRIVSNKDMHPQISILLQ